MWSAKKRSATESPAGVVFCGKYDAPDSGLRDPEPMREAKRASLIGAVGLLMVLLMVLDRSRFGLLERVRAARVRGVMVVTGTLTGSGRQCAAMQTPNRRLGTVQTLRDGANSQERMKCDNCGHGRSRRASPGVILGARIS